MLSIFKAIDNIQQGSYKFWMPYFSAFSEDIFSETLYEVSKNHVLKEYHYKLTTTGLIKNTNHKKFVPIEWKLVEPFVEESDKHVRYGFTLGHEGHCKDFYVSCKEKLDKWLDFLSITCIMMEIENDYKFIKRIGKGKWAHVFLAISRENSKKYAIKNIKKARLKEESIKCLIEEIRIMRNLNHPNIVKLYKVYESETHISLVIEHLKGGDLFSRLMKKKPISEEAVIGLSKNLLGVLEYLNSKKIVHRDIKLENILMVSKKNDDNFKLVDFGLATEVHEEGLTQICGSPGYIAPEVLNHVPYGTKADLFSAGVVIYILLSGSMPFTGKTFNQIICNNREAKIHFRQKKWESTSGDAMHFLLKLMDSRPNTRVNASEALKDPWFKQTELRVCSNM